MKKGKFIVFYGINNLGKTTQANLLVERLVTNGISAEYFKCPLYTMEPTGVIINEYLRQGNPYNLTPREFQMFYAMHRTQYQPILLDKLKQGIWMIGEDYSGTGISWGVGAGVDKEFLLRINNHLLVEDIAFLFDGDRFLKAKENHHKHESDTDLMNYVREVHLELGKEFDWVIVNANEPIESIRSQIWDIVQQKFIISLPRPDFENKETMSN